MGTHFTLALGLAKLGARKKTRKAKKTRMRGFSKIHTGFVLAVFLLVASFAYLFSVNAISTKGYEIQELERRLTELRESNKRLELEVTGLKSIQSVEDSVDQLNLVPSKVVKHLPGSDYALRD